MVAESKLPIASVLALASKRSEGKTVPFRDGTLTVHETTDDAFKGIDIALFSAGGSVSKRFAPAAVKAGAVVVDNTSAFRMNPIFRWLSPKSIRKPCAPTTASSRIRTVRRFKW